MTSRILNQHTHEQENDSDPDFWPVACFGDLATHGNSQADFALAGRRRISADTSSYLTNYACHRVLPKPGSLDRLESMFPQIFASESPVKIVGSGPEIAAFISADLRGNSQGIPDTKESEAQKKVLSPKTVSQERPNWRCHTVKKDAMWKPFLRMFRRYLRLMIKAATHR